MVEAEPAVGRSRKSPPALVEAAGAASDDAGALDDAGELEEAALVGVPVLLIPPALELALELSLDVAVAGCVEDTPVDETSTVEEVELAPGVVLEVGEGLSPPVPGTTSFFNVKSAWVTSSADSCWPTPEVPSQPSTYHLLPQALSSLPAHDFAAATAEVRSHVVTCSLVKGAMIAVFERKRDK